MAGCMPTLRLPQPPEPPPWQQPARFIGGNAVQVLAEGQETYAAMFAAIAQARHHIHIETYLLCDDRIGRELARRLLARQREGVAVRIIYDGQGSAGCTTPAFFGGLEAQGLEFAVFRPPRAGALIYPSYLNRRDHRKLLIVDGRIGFTGGINFNDVYAASPFLDGSGDATWRDTNLRVQGPAVAAFQRSFLRQWHRLAPLSLLPRRRFFPPLTAQGDAEVRLLESRGGADENPIYQSHVAAIRSARERVWLTHAYFAPEPNLMRALIQAAERGVDVRLMLPEATDTPATRWLAQSTYKRLLAAGIRVYERQETFLHAKTAVVDGRWSSIGSLNLDYRSLVHNDEVNAEILDPALARRMEALFREDMLQAQEIEPAAWNRRSAEARVKEWLSRLAAYWL
jgi:cardiolipin synthase